MVQLVSASVLSAVRAAADRAVAGAPAARCWRATTITSSSPFPSELNALWLANVRELANLLFHAAWATLSELLGDPKYLGATPGMIAALHTWGQTLVLHPHLHCLVTGGGWDGETWRAVRTGYLLPARVVMPVFRGKLLAAVHSALDAGQLSLPPGMTLPQLRMLLHRLGRTQWHVQLMTRYAHGQGVATYLARYLRGGPLKPGRIVAWDDQTVTFRYADNQDPDAQGRGTRKLLPLSADGFLAALAAACAAAGVTGRAGVWAVCAGQTGGVGAVSAGAGPSAAHGPAAAGLADVLCAAGAAASRALPGVWAAADPHGHGGPATPRPSGGSRAARTAARVAGGGMTRRSRLAPPRLQSSSVRRVAGARSPQGDRPCPRLCLPARAGSPRPSACAP